MLAPSSSTLVLLQVGLSYVNITSLVVAWEGIIWLCGQQCEQEVPQGREKRVQAKCGEFLRLGLQLGVEPLENFAPKYWGCPKGAPGPWASHLAC